MAKSIAEYILMRYFFPEPKGELKKDYNKEKGRKQQNKFKEEFLKDMSFQL